MAELIETFRIANAAVFTLLAAASLLHWRRRREGPGGWLTASFAILAVVLVESLVLPEEPLGALRWVQKVSVGGIFLFPYFLYRFTSAFGRSSRWVDLPAVALTALVVIWSLLIPASSSSGSGELRSPAMQAFILVVLVQWAGLSLVAAHRLWRAGRTQPTPGRRRMRLLSGAAVGLSAAIVLAALGQAGGTVVTLAVQVMALATGVLFFLGFAPPRALRLAWRQRENEEFQRALGELITATREEAVAARVLPHITNIVAGEGAALLDDAGNVIGRHRDVPNDLGGTADHGTSGDKNQVLRLPLRSGSLLVWASPYSPFFAREELDLLEALGNLTDLALERVRQEERAAQLADIVFGAHDAIISEDLQGNITSWNRGAEEIYGYSEDEAIGHSISMLAPADRAEEFSGMLDRIKTGERVDHYETLRRRKDGRLITVSLSVSPLRDVEGAIRGAAVIARDVTERKEVDRALADAKEEAERANLAKSEFLSRMSHELRTPLNAILGFGQLLQMEDLTEDQRQSVTEIVKGGRHLLDLINEVLDIARIEVGKLAISVEPVAVSDVVAEATSLIRGLADQRGLRLTHSGDGPTDLHVLADKQRLKQVLLNLLSNAVKYNSAGGSVRVFTQVSNGMVRISVSDTGPGIPEEERDRLFVPFERLGAERSTEEGTGLGLALSKRLIEAMGGTMGVESEDGRGSTFWADLPRTESPVELVEVEEEGLGEPAGDGLPARTVLYIEDNLSNLKLIERVLAKRPGINLLTAMQGRLGLDLARQHRPDLILLDLQLPDVQGKEVLRALKGDERTRDIAVIVVSADATKGQLRRLLEGGARAYLTKPVDVGNLLRLLDEELDRPA